MNTEIYTYFDISTLERLLYWNNKSILQIGRDGVCSEKTLRNAIHKGIIKKKYLNKLCKILKVDYTDLALDKHYDEYVEEIEKKREALDKRIEKFAAKFNSKNIDLESKYRCDSDSKELQCDPIDPETYKYEDAVYIDDACMIPNMLGTVYSNIESRR